MLATDTDDAAVFGRLVRELGHQGGVRLEPLTGGANNRAFRLEVGSSRYLAKRYHHSPDDPRPRLGAEFAFCEYAWRVGVTAAPRPVARDDELGAALYEFIEGSPIRAGGVTREHVTQLMAFWSALNEDRALATASGLPPAAESCHSLGDHARCVDARLARWSRPGAVLDPFGLGVREFVLGEVAAAWSHVHCALQRGHSEDDTPVEQRICPSDLSLLNAIVEPSGRLRLVDFEYAGWDDAAKCLSDVLLHPGVPLPVEFDTIVRDAAARAFGPATVERLGLVLPVHTIKWTLIVLNDFLADTAARRRFALGEDDLRTRHEAQLAKSHAFLRRLARAGTTSGGTS